MKPLPCPFCGSDEIGFESRYVKKIPHTMAVCQKCRAKGPPGYGITGATSRFNKRANPSVESVPSVSGSSSPSAFLAPSRETPSSRQDAKPQSPALPKGACEDGGQGGVS